MTHREYWGELSVSAFLKIVCGGGLALFSNFLRAFFSVMVCLCVLCLSKLCALKQRQASLAWGQAIRDCCEVNFLFNVCVIIMALDS